MKYLTTLLFNLILFFPVLSYSLSYDNGAAMGGMVTIAIRENSKINTKALPFRDTEAPNVPYKKILIYILSNNLSYKTKTETEKEIKNVFSKHSSTTFFGLTEILPPTNDVSLDQFATKILDNHIEAVLFVSHTNKNGEQKNLYKEINATAKTKVNRFNLFDLSRHKIIWGTYSKSPSIEMQKKAIKQVAKQLVETNLILE